VEIIDLHSQFNTPEWFLADSVHPNATGAKELARIIKEGILKAPADTSKTPADTSKTPADTVPEVSDSTGTQDSTTAIRGNEFARDAGSSQERNARGFGGQDAHSFVNQDARKSKAYDMQGRYIPSRKQAASPTVKKGGTR
jgi:hypothetical protein